MAGDTVIEVEGLTKRFGTTLAVDGLSLTVGRGEIFGLLGPNGAGKTTTMRMLACLISRTSGSARIDGLDVADAEDRHAIRARIGVLPENVGLYVELSATRNLDVYGRLYGMAPADREARIEELLRAFGLWERRDDPAGSFSKGMKQKLALARAIIHDPEVVFLDEPTANLDPEAAKQVHELILSMKGEGRTIVLNTHDLHDADRFCDRVGVLRTSLAAVGTPKELRARFWGAQTLVRFASLDDALLGALQAAIAFPVERHGDDAIVVHVDDLQRDTPAIVAAAVNAGGLVLAVTEVRPELEDVYFRVLQEARS